MARGGSKPGERRGGRKKGSLNKNSLSTIQKLNDKGCDPIELLADIAMGKPMRAMVGLNKDVGDIIVENVPPSLDQRLAACKELAQYVAPKLKSIEHKGDVDSSITIRWMNGGDSDSVQSAPASETDSQ